MISMLAGPKGLTDRLSVLESSIVSQWEDYDTGIYTIFQHDFKSHDYA